MVPSPAEFQSKRQKPRSLVITRQAAGKFQSHYQAVRGVACRGVARLFRPVQRNDLALQFHPIFHIPINIKISRRIFAVRHPQTPAYEYRFYYNIK